uniref:Notchless protein-like n=1 Tax=Hirondellea gigas TaxID=1518452 RepID=A0A2P2I5R8_9CRUS
MPPLKRSKMEEADAEQTSTTMNDSDNESESCVTTVITKFISPDGIVAGTQMAIPINATPLQLQLILNTLLKNDHPYSFFLENVEILNTLESFITENNIKTESVLPIIYQPQAIFRVRSVTRCTSSLPGHSEAILVVRFSPDGTHLASGSGDTTIRLWDVNTETPQHVLKGHKGWVQTLEFSPNGAVLASGSMDGLIWLWNPRSGKSIRRPLKAHTKGVMSLAWQPLHRNSKCDRLASAGKDGIVKIWHIGQGRVLKTLSGHTAAVTCVRWGGEGFIYSVSRDQTIRVWIAETGELKRILEGHAHWVNHCSLSTDYALRTGWFDHTGTKPNDEKEALQRCKDRYAEAFGKQGELLVSGSDDHTAYLWNPILSAKPVNRLFGHQQPINYVSFSPNGRFIATACFDKSVRLWDGRTGKYLATFRGHVGAIYQVCWSADSRLLVTSSKDSTMKIWDIQTRKQLTELPGHADEVYAVDWSPDGQRVASGSKDRFLKIWRR